MKISRVQKELITELLRAVREQEYVHGSVPVVTISTLASRLSLARSTVRYHLDSLLSRFEENPSATAQIQKKE